MLVKKISPFTGQVASMEIPCTEEQMQRWQSGELIQNAMPNLTPGQREFLISGITPDEWKKMFGEA